MEKVDLVRNSDGFFYHPEYTSAFAGKDYLSWEEFHGWAKYVGIELHYELSDDGGTDRLPELRDWNPTKPDDGLDWNVLAITEDEDGPYCVWFRNVE